MSKVLSPDQAPEISGNLIKQNKCIVLVGGCFDILHIGHITFLTEARKLGDTLIVLLEHDDTIKKNKGDDRPINTQQDRATILASLSMVDYVIKLPPTPDDSFYDELVNKLKPAIIATTAGDPNRHHKERDAKLVGASVVDVTGPIYNQSTTKLLNILKEL